MLTVVALFACVYSSISLLMFDRECTVSVESENACLLAMCEADSGCVPNGCSVDQNQRIGCGYFRLNIYQFKDHHIVNEGRGKTFSEAMSTFPVCQTGNNRDVTEDEVYYRVTGQNEFIRDTAQIQCYQPGKKEGEDQTIAWINCAEDFDCSASCIRTLGSKFRGKCYGRSDCESLARIHDGGANGCRDRKTAFYWKRVRDDCGPACSKPIFTRYRRLTDN